MSFFSFTKKLPGKNLSKIAKIRLVGIVLISMSLLILLSVYLPVIFINLNFWINKPDELRVPTLESEVDQKKEVETVRFVNEDFAIFVPKINANASIVATVDPFNKDEYLDALKKGIAHARGTATPDRKGNVFLFAHSAMGFYDATRNNVQFYLLNNLEKEDDIYVAYQGKRYHYKVTDKKIVDPSDLQYLINQPDEYQITLMTCWPAGVNFKRVIIIGTLIN